MADCAFLFARASDTKPAFTLICFSFYLLCFFLPCSPLTSPSPQYKSVFRSYSQDFAPHSPAPTLPLMNPAIFYSSRYSPVLPDSVPSPPAPLCPPLPSSQGGSSCGTPPACLPFEPPFSSSLQTSVVRMGGGLCRTGLCVGWRAFVNGKPASVSVPLSLALCCAAAFIASPCSVCLCPACSLLSYNNHVQ